MKINVNGVSITLTKEQLKEIDKQLKNTKTLDDLISHEAALEILGEIDESQSKQDELFNIIRAANYLDNDNKPWKAVLNGSEYNYIPWLEKRAGSSGWGFFIVSVQGSYSVCPSTFYFKKRNTAELICKRFLPLYNQVWG